MVIFSSWPHHVARDWSYTLCNGSSLHHWTTREVPEALFFFLSESLLLDYELHCEWRPAHFLAKGNFSKFPQGQITQEGITLTIQHSKRRGSWGYPWLVCKPLLNPPVFWSSPTLLCLVLWIQGLSLLPPRWTSNGRGRSLAAHIGEEALALQLGILPKVRQLTF